LFSCGGQRGKKGKAANGGKKKKKRLNRLRTLEWLVGKGGPKDLDKNKEEKILK